MAISEKDIEHLKNLARVEFGNAETQKLTKDLGGILEYAETLKEADISGAAEMTHATEGVKNVMRPDAPSSENSSYDAGEITGAFPKKTDSGGWIYLKVKPIL